VIRTAIWLWQAAKGAAESRLHLEGWILFCTITGHCQESSGIAVRNNQQYEAMKLAW